MRGQVVISLVIESFLFFQLKFVGYFHGCYFLRNRNPRRFKLVQSWFFWLLRHDEANKKFNSTLIELATDIRINPRDDAFTMSFETNLEICPSFNYRQRRDAFIVVA